MSLPSVEQRRCSLMPARVFAGLVLALFAFSAHASDARECRAAGGKLLIGEVVSPPKFKHGMYKKGVELSHTHLTLRDKAGEKYDVAIDNVFASGYRPNSKAVPAPLDTIEVGDKLEVCGIPFDGGIHWVHNNCGDTPTKSDPNGWIKVVRADGSTGPNLEESQTYCRLWPHR
ncbi:hypothetical protein [Bordetella sp. LUAb4]|uniref:hypothetical protein n=1 Tax=Bordetella sp. LUAb4 TaxID=2843195 RepID=UPI001E397AA6|nr:hypothetical protein [Bordetella sp. LUAb4]